jgi:hypothetical protein
MKVEKRIYLDQFMLENKRIKELQEKIADAEPTKITNPYTSYGEGYTDLLKSLKTSLNFLKTNKDNDELMLVDLDEEEEEEEETKIVYDPKDLEVTGNIKAAVEVLEDAVDKVNDQVNKIKESLYYYKQSLVNTNETKKYPYDLQAIIMCYQEYDKNQYYVFIRDGTKWRKYKDEEVTEENEESVFCEIMKEVKPEGLVYVAVNNELSINSKQKDFTLSMSKLMNNANQSINCYDSPLPHEVKRQVFEDNLKLDKEVVNANVTQFSSKVIEIYKKRHEKLMKRKKRVNYSEWNFVADLEFKNSPHYRYTLLDSIIRELSGEVVSLNSLEEDDNLYKALNEAAIKECNFTVGSLRLSKEEEKQIEVHEKAFINSLVCKRVQEQILIKSVAKEWEQALKIIEIYITKKLYCDHASNKLMVDLLKMLSLRFVSLVSNDLMNKNFTQLLTPVKYITRHVANLIDVNDTHVKHCKRYIEFMITKCSTRIPKGIVEEIENELKLLDENNKVEGVTIPINTVH